MCPGIVFSLGHRSTVAEEIEKDDRHVLETKSLGCW